MEDRNVNQQSTHGSSTEEAMRSHIGDSEQHEAARLRKENSDLREQLIAMERSRSWRVTAPMRRGVFVARHARWKFSASVRTSVDYSRLAFHHGYQQARSKARHLPAPIKRVLRPIVDILRNFGSRFTEPHNIHMLNQLAEKRKLDESFLIKRGGLSRKASNNDESHLTLPLITISLVTYNSSRWLNALFNSIQSQTYPLERIKVAIVDNGSNDDTLDVIASLKESIGSQFASFELHQRPNLGFGAAHNWAVNHSQGEYALITNPDLEFDPDAISRVVSIARTDESNVACWELRQRPYEHPKHYDPVTWETHWSSHACILIRRSAFDQINGYDERIFLYGEDVEFSFRMREAGFRLRYCPCATVAHYTYEEAHQVKPAQYLGSTRANLYLRLRYGTLSARIATVGLAVASIARPQPFDGARQRLIKEYVALLKQLPSLRRERKQAGNKSVGVFRGLDYELTREGAFIASDTAVESLSSKPLVTIITRTYQGRDWLLRQAGLSVLNQTYRSIEWVVVEDGGTHCAHTVEKLALNADIPVRYFSQDKLGRSAAGNLGLEKAQGEWCLFLDDDDLLYADHLELLVRTAMDCEEPQAAVYSLAWDVVCDVDKEKQHINELLYQTHGQHRLPFSPQRLANENFFSIQAIMFRRALYEEHGGFNEALDQLEDWNLWRRYAHGRSFQLVEKTTSLYRTPANLATRQQRQLALDNAYHDVKRSTDQELALRQAHEPGNESTAGK